MRKNLWMGHLGFVLTGIANTALGPILPTLSQRWSLDDVHAGQLFTAEFLGAVTGTIVASRLMSILGCRRTAAIGLFATAVGIAAIGVSGPHTGAACLVCLGLGLGISMPPINLWITLAEPERSAAASNLLNASWCVGAAASAPIIIFLGSRTTLPRILDALAILLVLMASIIGAEREPQPLARIDQHASAPAVKWTALDRREFVAFIAAIFFVYIGTESGIGGWVTTYAERLYLFPAGSIGFAQSTFYGALLIGRLAAPFILRKMKGRNLVLLSLGVSAAGLALSVTALQAAAVLAGLFIAGIGFAAVFPTTVATFSDRLGADAIRLSAWIFPLGYIGAAVIPFVMGAASEKFHALRYGMIAALVFILIMIALQMQIIRILRRESPAA